MEEKMDYKGHYYGKLIRFIFLISGVIMLVGFPFFGNLISLPAYISLFGIIALVLLGGLISPISKFVFIISSIIPIPAFVLFEYYAFYAYQHLPASNPVNVAFFWVNQILAIMFFFATYFSIKTLRAMMQGKMTTEIE